MPVQARGHPRQRIVWRICFHGRTFTDGRLTNSLPRKDFRAGRSRNNVGEGDLFDREKRSDFIAARTDEANGAGNDEEEKVAGTRKSQVRGGHENRPDDQHAPPSDTVRSCCQIKRDNDITDQRQRKNEAHLRLGKP